ncbi:MAG: amino acid permease [Gemmatimonadaceae bacterium]|nr:amino acid permease [Gemmatimonadaceae bacterium]
MHERRIGLWGAVATLVGYVIGASIFVLPAELLPSTGAGVILSYAIAAIPAVFTCVAGAVVGNAFPVSGASYVGVRETMSPFFAFLTAWLIVCAGAIGAALVAYGFADYIAFFVPAIDARACAVGVVLAFVLLNLTPVTVTVAAQAAMVVFFAVVLAAFAAGGFVAGDWGRLSPLVPHGWSPVLAGAVAAYFSYAGLQVLIEVGGEIREPGRTIPRALAISFAVVLALYLLFVIAMVLLSDTTTPASANALVGRMAEEHFGAGFARAVVLSALLAAATSVNGIFFTQARDVRALALDGRLPRLLARDEGGIPRPAVLALGAASLLATAAGASIREYAILTAMCMMTVQAMLGLSALRLPARAPVAWQRSPFKPSPAVLAFFGWGLVVISIAFLALAVAQSPGSVLTFAGALAAGAVLYRVQLTPRREGA